MRLKIYLEVFKPMAKISKRKVMETVPLTLDKYNYMQKHYPRRLELIKKGILYEQIENKELTKEKI